MKTIKPLPRSVLSLDVGTKRIGLAGCDPLGITITKLKALKRCSFETELKLFSKICSEREVQGLIVGLPLDDFGRSTSQSIITKKYGNKIAIDLKLPIAWVNEHSSSWEAGEINNLHSDRTGELDSAAAVLLLKQWLREGPELKPVQMAAHFNGH